jgi:hypothetical protein
LDSEVPDSLDQEPPSTPEADSLSGQSEVPPSPVPDKVVDPKDRSTNAIDPQETTLEL